MTKTLAESFFESLNSDADVRDLIARRENERLHLDFKGEPQERDRDRLLAKAISGFANADGGVLIFGIDARDGNLSEAPVKDVATFERIVNEQIPRAVSFQVEGILTKAIPAGGGPGGFVLVLVPASDLAPHRSEKDKIYYRRSGESFMPLEHYEVADLFGRRPTPRLRLHAEPYAGSLKGGPSGRSVEFHVALGLENYGRGLARFPMLGLAVGRPWELQYRPDGRSALKPVFASPTRGRLHLYSGGASEVVHSGAVAYVTSASIDVKQGQTSLADLRISYEIAADGVPRFEAEHVLTGEELLAVAQRVIAEWHP